MSAATHAALEAALAAHISDENPGDYVGAYLLIACTDTISDGEPAGAYQVIAPNGQATHVSQGLAGHLSVWITKNVQRSIGG